MKASDYRCHIFEKPRSQVIVLKPAIAVMPIHQSEPEHYLSQKGWAGSMYMLYLHVSDLFLRISNATFVAPTLLL